MDLSYEETMRRIDEHEQSDPFGRKLCRQKNMPYHIHIYKGEGQVLIVPLITAACGLSVEMARYWRVPADSSAKELGRCIFEALGYIKNRPVDARTTNERKNDAVMRCATKCKNYKTFYKKYFFDIFTYHEDGSYTLAADGHNEIEFVYDRRVHRKDFPPDTSPEQIGQTLLQQFADMEEFYRARKKQKPARARTTIETLSGSKLSFEAPKDGHYVDEEDYGAAEVYQGYSYRKESEEEAVADMYFSIAAELDCDLSPENVSQVYKKLYGADVLIDRKDVDHPVFEKCIEVTSTQIHHVVYVRQVDEAELLACELVVKLKPAGKRIYNKVLKDFESLLASVEIV